MQSALASHFAFGAMAGLGYAPLLRAAPQRKALPAAANGVMYGMMVWTAQYLGVLPAMGILSRADRHPARRNGLMITAHVVWRAAFGLTAAQLGRRDR
ncbi:MAG: DUF1440 domain-containing protein [Acidobacteria bacterium]|nr:DUF1440 domain-containing protein [Acidobacteriota bacterium]